MDAEQIIQRVAQQKGVDPVTMLNSILGSLSTEHLFSAVEPEKRPTVLERLIELFRDQQRLAIAEQGKNLIKPDDLKQMIRENEAVYLVLQELQNEAERYSTETLVKIAEDRRRREGR